MLGLGLVRGGSVIWGYANSKEDVGLWTSRASYDWKCWERWAEEGISSTKRMRGQKVCSVIQSDVLGSSVDKDMYCERIGQMAAEKYLGESCYYRIKCFVANSLATLMRKWYLSSAFQPYSYPQRLQEGTNGTRINTSNLMSTWRVKMREEI